MSNEDKGHVNNDWYTVKGKKLTKDTKKSGQVLSVTISVTKLSFGFLLIYISSIFRSDITDFTPNKWNEKEKYLSENSLTFLNLLLV